MFFLLLAGWGHTQEDWLGSNELLKANVSIIPRKICNGPLSYNGKVGERQFCAGSMDGGVDTCQVRAVIWLNQRKTHQMNAFKCDEFVA